MRTTRHNVLKVFASLALVLALASAAEAGPPLICHPFDAGTAALLTWSTGPGWRTPDRSYDVQRLTGDMLKLLAPDAPVIARMENMRRATIYATSNKRVAEELLAALLGRVAQSSDDPLAWFDAGYLIESYRQAKDIADWDMPTAAQRDGYSFVQKAITLARSNPEMEFAASLMARNTAAAEHRRRAVAGAAKGSLLAKNLATFGQ